MANRRKERDGKTGRRGEAKEDKQEGKMARECKRRRWQDRGKGHDKRQDQAMQGLARQKIGKTGRRR